MKNIPASQQLIQKKEAEFGEHPNIIFYMAVAPQLVPDIAKKLGKGNICRDKAFTRIVIEKPFGHDLCKCTRAE